MTFIINSTTQENGTSLDDGRPGWVDAMVYAFEAYIQPITLAAGIVTNVLNLIVLSKIRLVSVFRVILIALAISDLLATLCGFLQIVLEVAFYAGDLPFGRWELKAVTNYALYFLFLQFLSTSATIVVLFTATRNVLVTKPLQSKKYLTTRRIKLICGACFLVTALLYLPTSLNVLWQGCYGSLNTSSPCAHVFREVPDLEQVSNSYLFSLAIGYGPVMLLAYITCIVHIQCSLRRSRRFLNTMTSHNGVRRVSGNDVYVKKRNEQSSRFTRTLFQILLLDTVCIIPTIAVGISLLTTPQDTLFSDKPPVLAILDVLAEEFLNIRPLYNFWIYCFTQREFRRCLFRLPGLAWCRTECCRKKPVIRRRTSSYELNMNYSSSNVSKRCENMADSVRTDSPTLLVCHL